MAATIVDLSVPFFLESFACLLATAMLAMTTSESTTTVVATCCRSRSGCGCGCKTRRLASRGACPFRSEAVGERVAVRVAPVGLGPRAPLGLPHYDVITPRTQEHSNHNRTTQRKKSETKHLSGNGHLAWSESCTHLELDFWFIFASSL